MSNKTLEQNCRPASPLNAWRQFGPAVHAPSCVSGGSRSALRCAKKMKSIFYITLLSFVSISFLEAAPWRMKDTITFEGRILSAVWIKSEFTYEGDDSTLAGSSSQGWFIIIKAPELTDAQRTMLTGQARIDVYSGVSHFMMRKKLKGKQMLFYLPIPKEIKIKKDSKIEVEGYTAWGDEHMVVPTIRSLKIDGKVIKLPKSLLPKEERKIEPTKAQQGVAPQSATRPESKSKSGDKPQPESEARSR